MAVFTQYDSAVNTPTDLATAALGGGISILGATYTGDDMQASFFSGDVDFGLTSGILLTSGDGTPELENLSSGAGLFVGTAGDAQLDAIVQAVYDPFEITYDAAFLNITFSVAAGTNAVKFNLVFGSEEYPEWADSFVDIAGVFVDGINYAYFDGNPLAPLSVLQSNIDAGYFIDNDPWSEATTAGLPIEYDGVSNLLSFVAPINSQTSTHTIKIAIADTGDSILDSAILFTGLTTDKAFTGGVKQQIDGTDGNDTTNGTDLSEYALLGLGDDTMDAGGGNDNIKGNQGDDTLYGGDGLDEVYGGVDDDLLFGNKNGDTLQGGQGNDTVSGNKGWDRVQGAAGDDSLMGGEGADTLIGGAGNDTMWGSVPTGNDTLGDQFWFLDASGDDHVMDFVPGTDELVIFLGVNGSSINSAAGALAAATDMSDDTWIVDLTGPEATASVMVHTAGVPLTEADFTIL